MLPLETLLGDVARQAAGKIGRARMPGWTRAGGDDGALEQTRAFGADPGNLRMLSFVPDDLPPGAPLVVVLHGCTQTAAGFDRATGWSELAERHGFALLYPEQRRANNGNVCFNWFEPADIARGQGEVASIRFMVEHILREHALDRRRVFVTGLSAGGAMAAALLATYPDVFAAGAIVAGLPFGCASGVQQALERMHKDAPRPPRDWGDVVRAASPHRGPWPRVAIWHGTADTTVRPSNAMESVKQWLDVHGLRDGAGVADELDGHPRRIWRGADGEARVELVLVRRLSHGVPIAPHAPDPEQRCGTAAPYVLDAGISAPARTAAFFGLAGPTAARSRPSVGPANPGANPGAKPGGARPAAGQADRGRPEGRSVDPARVVSDALRSVGLLKR